MLYRAGSRYDHLSGKGVDVPRAFPPRCAVTHIATVVEGSRWGGWVFNDWLGGERQSARWAWNGWTIEHRIGLGLYVVAEGSELTAHVPGVLQRVAVDAGKGL